jgi:adenylate cyclase
MRPRPFQISFTVTILTAFALLFVAAVWLVANGYRQTGARAALVTAERSLAQAAETAAASTLALIRPVVALATVVPEFAPLGDPAALTSRDTAALLSLLGAEPAVQVISVGLADGTLRQVARATSLARDKVPVLPSATAFVVRDVSLSSRQESWTFLDAGLQPLGQLALASTEPDARLTQWYLQAQDGLVHVSTLYDLALVGRPGLSVSRRMPGSNAVFSLDITLEQLAGFLNGLRASPNSLVFLFTEDGILLAHPRQDLAAMAQAGGSIGWTTLRASADPVLRLVWDAYAQGRLRPGQAESLDGPNSALVVRLVEVGDLPPPRLLLAVAAPLSDFTAPLDAALQEGTVRAVLALLGGLLASGILAWRISHPLRVLTQEAAAIQRLEFQPRTPVRSHIAEVARLAGAMEGMKSALRVFGAYVPRNLVGRLMQEQAAGRLGGEKRRITVMFSDVEGFTSLAEGIPPEDLMHIASAYFEEITGELLSCHATIDKYIGDAVMALWNAPQDDGSHAQNACRAALQARLLTDRLCDRFEARGWPRLRTRFGVHTGEAVVGNVGSSDRMSYTAIGSMVNLAARLEGMNKSYGTRILISEATRAAAGACFVTRPVDLVLAKGSDRPIELHELLGFAVVDSLADAPLRPDRRIATGLPAWRRMIGAYRAARFEEAAAALAEAGDPAHDPLAAIYAERLSKLRAGTPPDWSPVLRFTSK